MKAQNKLSRLLWAPLVHSAALLFLLEQWLWNASAQGMAQLAAWPPLTAIETRVQALPPRGALIVFVLPSILLLPVKLFGLFAIARGHVMWGASIIILAKLVGTAVVARLYALTGPNLLTVAWFARWHGSVLDVKDRLIAGLHATGAWRREVADSLRALLASLHPGQAFGSRASIRPLRMLRRFIALVRARRR